MMIKRKPKRVSSGEREGRIRINIPIRHPRRLAWNECCCDLFKLKISVRCWWICLDGKETLHDSTSLKLVFLRLKWKFSSRFPHCFFVRSIRLGLEALAVSVSGFSINAIEPHCSISIGLCFRFQTQFSIHREMEIQTLLQHLWNANGNNNRPALDSLNNKNKHQISIVMKRWDSENEAMDREPINQKKEVELARPGKHKNQKSWTLWDVNRRLRSSHYQSISGHEVAATISTFAFLTLWWNALHFTDSCDIFDISVSVAACSIEGDE
jgi:hypothetical protein